MQQSQNDRILRLPEFLRTTGLSRSAIYDRLDTKSPRHDPTFPKKIKLSQRSVGFSERETSAWLAARIAERDGVQA
jgi:prophage regulatory protein